MVSTKSCLLSTARHCQTSVAYILIRGAGSQILASYLSPLLTVWCCSSTKSSYIVQTRKFSFLARKLDLLLMMLKMNWVYRVGVAQFCLFCSVDLIELTLQRYLESINQFKCSQVNHNSYVNWLFPSTTCDTYSRCKIPHFVHSSTGSVSSVMSKRRDYLLNS